MDRESVETTSNRPPKGKTKCPRNRMEIIDELSFSAQYADGCYWIRLKLCLNRRRAEESLVYSGLGFECEMNFQDVVG